MSYKHIYGPVSSRRLGVSLGVDCVNFKTCNLDCIYCECGTTTNLTMERMEYVSASGIIAELGDFLSKKPCIDHVSFGGSGEPTLNSRIGEILDFVKSEFPHYKTALLTNGTLFYMPEVRKEIMAFDSVLPSFDAASDEVFRKINRNHGALNINLMIEGLVAFAEEYSGALLVEVFIVPGINDGKDELKLFKDIFMHIRPTRIQLNSLDRPGTCSDVRVAPAELLAGIADFFAPLPVEIISRNAHLKLSPEKTANSMELLFSTINRRPLTVEESSSLLGITINQCIDILGNLVDKGKVSIRNVNGRMFYGAKEHNENII
jgi:wyosine [tRNA(Phe)-imidazoG37] synthetase (radical SAM superfamily)